MKNVYVEKTILGYFKPISEEEWNDKIDNGYAGVYIDSQGIKGIVEPVRVHILADFVWFCDRESLENLANDYLSYISAITGSELTSIKL